MRASSSFGQILTAAVALSGTVAAWPEWLPDVDALVVRQDSSPPPTATQTADPTTAADKASATDKATSTDDGKKSDQPKKTDDPNTANLNTGGMTITGTGKGSKPTGKGGNSTHSMFDPRDPVGGISMITPAPTDGTQLYRIGDTVHLEMELHIAAGHPHRHRCPGIVQRGDGDVDPDPKHDVRGDGLVHLGHQRLQADGR